MPRGKSEDPSILQYALRALEQERDQLQAKIDDIHRQLGGRKNTPSASAKTSTPATAPKTATRKKRILSDSARKRIAAAQKKRWAEHRKNAQSVATTKKSPKRSPKKTTASSE